MAERSLAESLERLVFAGVALTTRALSEATPGLELTLPQWRVLVVLGEADDGATVSEVAARIGVTVPATSRQLRRLERRGLVAVAPDEHDRRATRVRLTSNGWSVREAIIGHRRARIAEAAARLRPSARLAAEFARIADALDALDGRQ